MTSNNLSTQTEHGAPTERGSNEYVDVIVIGAGISGISAGYYLQRDCPDRSFAILEGRDDLGGTWDLFRYPGIRSDSDMYTLGFSFRPWTDEVSIARGERILDYLRSTVEAFNLDRHIRYRHRVVRAEWNAERACWTVTVDHGGHQTQIDGALLFMCAGYYSYEAGYRPDFPGLERFAGTVVHPQHWPDDLKLDGQRVVVIGSGATAMTLVPAIAPEVEHVTMLQRSPTYVVSRPSIDPIGRWLQRLLPDRLASKLIRAKNVGLVNLFYRKTRTDPDQARSMLLDDVREHLGDEITDAHFTPSYDPWDQRLCLIPDGDLYDAINSGKASVTTDTISSITESGIELDSGEHLDADVIVTATGLQLVTAGGIEVIVDGEPVDFSQTWTYKGLAYSGVPNLVATFGFINASWTLRAEMIARYVTRLLDHLRDTDTDIAVPRLRPSDADMVERPFIDDFPAGYITRSRHLLPKQGDRAPWLNTQDVYRDRRLIDDAPIDDGAMTFERSAQRRPVAASTS